MNGKMPKQTWCVELQYKPVFSKIRYNPNYQEYFYNQKKFDLVFQSLIFQMPKPSNQYPFKMLQSIIKTSNGQIYDLTSLLYLCDKNYVHYYQLYQNLKHDKDKYLCKYQLDFSNIQQIKEMLQFFYKDISQDEINNQISYFQNKFSKNTNAFTRILDENNICIFLNKGRYNLPTIYHELMYCFQHFFNILFLKDIKYNIPQVNDFKLPQQFINEIFQDYEIFPNIVTLCFNLEDFGDVQNKNFKVILSEFFKDLIKNNLNDLYIKYVLKFKEMDLSLNGLFIMILSYRYEKQLFLYLKKFMQVYAQKLSFQPEDVFN